MRIRPTDAVIGVEVAADGDVLRGKRVAAVAKIVVQLIVSRRKAVLQLVNGTIFAYGGEIP